MANKKEKIESKTAFDGKEIAQNTNKSKEDLVRSIEIACKRLSGRALELLEKGMEKALAGEIDFKVGADCAKEVLNRGWGRPKQNIEATVNVEGGDKMVEILQNARARAGTVVAVDSALQTAKIDEPQVH